jgi:hypothetical protein
MEGAVVAAKILPPNFNKLSMNLKSFFRKLKQTPQNITFTETIAVEENYVFHQQHSKTEYSQCSGRKLWFL